MQTANLTELRRNISRYLDAVEEGDTVRVYRHGKAVAVIQPANADDLPAWKKPFKPIKIKGGPISDTVIQERRESEH
jgi:prevent-host-death family protein